MRYLRGVHIVHAWVWRLSLEQQNRAVIPLEISRVRVWRKQVYGKWIWIYELFFYIRMCYI